MRPFPPSLPIELMPLSHDPLGCDFSCIPPTRLQTLGSRPAKQGYCRQSGTSVSSIEELPKNINKVLELNPRNPTELEQIRNTVLTCSSNSDEKAAISINALISKHQKVIS